MFDITLAKNNDSLSQAELLNAFVHHPYIDLHAKDSAGETMLHKVARFDLTEAAEILLQLPTTDMLVREEEHNYAPIQLSVREKSFGVAAILLPQWDVNVDDGDKHGNTLLHLLAAVSLSPRDAPDEVILMKGSFTKTLVSRDDVDLNACNSRGYTPLHVAVEANNVAFVEAMFSVPGGKLRIDQRDQNKQTPLLLATHGGKTDVAKLFLSRSDVDVYAANEDRQTPLHLAARANDAEIATIIISRDDVNVNVQDKERRTPLHWASISDAAEVAKCLLSKKTVDVSARDYYEKTPLHLASEFNAVEVAKVFLSRDDVDVNVKGKNGNTPLHLASRENNAEVASILLSRDDVNASARGMDESKPLHFAAWYDAVKVAKILLSREDVDVNANADGQWTPLHIAAMTHKVEATKLLVSFDDVDVEARDFEGNTPLDIATQKDATGCIELLREATVNVDVDAQQ